MMPSFSLAALTVLELAPPALVDVAAACGYDHVGIRLLPAVPGGIAYPLMEDEASLRETIARLDATGITVADLEVVAFRPETGIAAFSAFFETGARLGARHILVAAYDPDLDRFTDRFAGFCEAAAPSDVPDPNFHSSNSFAPSAIGDGFDCAISTSQNPTRAIRAPLLSGRKIAAPFI
jgi:hypothetical protein